MNIKVATIVLPLDLSLYHESFAGKKLLVWVNPPRDVLEERIEIVRTGVNELTPSKKEKHDSPKLFMGLVRKYIPALKKSVNERMFEWLNKIWSQHEDEDCAWPLADIRELYEADPAMYQWMVRRTVEMIAEFRAESKKK